MPSRLQQTIAEYRQRLLDHERTAMASLDYAHKQTLALIEPQLNTLFRAMTAKMQAGETIPLEWLFENNRLLVLEQYIRSSIDHFGAITKMQVESLQHMGVRLGMEAGQAVLQSTVPMGVNFSFGIPSQQAIANLIGATQKGSPLSDLFTGFGKEAAQGAKNALISGVTLGYGPRQIAPSIQDALTISRNRALTIARTEAIRSYRGANQETFQANSDVVSQWRWTCALSVRTCAACIAMDGTLHDVDEDMGSHPCCRCVMTPVTKSWDDILSPLGIDTTGIEDTNPALDMQTGQEWFSKQDEETQRRILGNAKYDAYAEGKFTLQDVVGHSHDKDWGSSIYERSLKDTLEAAGHDVKVPKPFVMSDELEEDENFDMFSFLQDHAPPEPELQDEEILPGSVGVSSDFDPLKGNIDDVAKYLAEHGGDTWEQSLTDEEKQAVYEYTQGGYRPMNSLLRNGNLGTGYDGDYGDLAATQARTDMLQEALLKSSFPADFVTVRGYGDSLLEMFQSSIGDTFKEKGFCSTTLFEDPNFHGFKVNIHVFEGAPGAYLNDLGRFRAEAEQEVLLPYNAEFKIIGGKLDAYGQWVFDLEYRGIASGE